MMGQTKTCNRCEHILPISNFRVYSSSDRKYLSSQCKSCDSEYAREWRKNNIERCNSNSRRWRKNNQRSTRNTRLKNKYGITIDDYDKMISDQASKCKICGCVSKLVVDHCHKTSVVRGLLCHSCNSLIGMFKESEEYINKAIEYLGKYNSEY